MNKEKFNFIDENGNLNEKLFKNEIRKNVINSPIIIKLLEELSKT